MTHTSVSANSGACPQVVPHTSGQWSLSSSGAPYFRTVEPVLQWCPILQDSGACPPVVPHTSGQWSLSSSGAPYFRTVEHVLQWCPILQDSGACPSVVPHTSGPVDSCKDDGYPAAPKSARLLKELRTTAQFFLTSDLPVQPLAKDKKKKKSSAMQHVDTSNSYCCCNRSHGYYSASLA